MDWSVDPAATIRNSSEIDITFDNRGHMTAGENIQYKAGDYGMVLCAQPVTFEELLKGLFDHYGMAMSFQQYALIGSTVRSYLTWLQETGRVAAEFADNRMLWRRV